MERHEHDTLDALTRDPYPHYARARGVEGLTFVPELDAWLIARDADVREVLRRPDEFSSANALRPDVLPSPAVLAELGKGFGGRPVVVTSDGETHQRLRAPIVQGLSPARVAAIIPYMTEQAELLVDALVREGGGTAELMGAYATKLPGRVIGRLIGLDPADVPVAVRGGHRAEELLFRPLDPAEQLAAARDVVTMQRLLDRCIRERRAEPRDDLCSGLLEALAPGTGDLTLDERHEVVAHLQNFLLAGHLTTTALIGTTLLHLLSHRPQWERLCAEPELIPQAIEEAARYDTALQGFRRITTRTVTLSGTELPPGTAVFVAYGSANRDALRYDRPDAFDITRRGSRHLAFGYGVHACPGVQLAREQLRLTVGLFARRLPGLRLADDRPVEMRPTMIHRSPAAVHLAWA
ncbi:cytochrome P450 [Streptomyces beijiangensis]|uniref:Cytochrome P450 n=1 Tax=Streptomyces beijiangensis TaxID=163361 RepID=A0A939F9I0_9ACTN|nr:cytochrome P450 [Streptomyces beijiangensis]MBO0514013.1 cytochrome P450 [Streptomyces beijiangensis]